LRNTGIKKSNSNTRKGFKHITTPLLLLLLLVGVEAGAKHNNYDSLIINSIVYEFGNNKTKR
jgi:hypothetical protein